MVKFLKKSVSRREEAILRSVRNASLPLERIKRYYMSIDTYTDGILIDVCYNDIIAKSGRMTEVLKDKSDCNNTIVGARFSDSHDQPENHIITH